MPFATIDLRIADAGGEDFSFREQVLMAARLMRTTREEFPTLYPAEFIGSIGVASGLCQVALADEALRRSGVRLNTILCCTTDESGTRAAVVLKAEKR
jgi:hypothetical protein